MKNMGKIDKTIRMILGILLLLAGVGLQIFFGKMWWLGIIGLVFLVTSAISFCPLYVPFKIKTNKGK